MGSRKILDEISGYEFEELMMDIYRKQGFEHVRNPGKSGDEGRDIIMEKNGRPYIVECKHKSKVSRPTVQKLHSAVKTYSEGAKGILVTTGRFTKQAKEYVEGEVNVGEEVLKLTNGKELREIGERVGLNLYSGKIEVLCDEVVNLPTERYDAERKVSKKFDDIRNFSSEYIDSMNIEVEMVPALHVEAETDAVFETSVGKIHEVHARDEMNLKAGRSGADFSDGMLPEIVPEAVSKSAGTIRLDERRFSEVFDEVRLRRFQKTETDYKDEIKEEIKDMHEETVHYTGDNNVTYEKDCRPKNSDVKVKNITPVYVPLLKSRLEIEDYRYKEEFYTSNHGDIVEKDGIHECVHCNLGDLSAMELTFCDNCGSINCLLHTRKERLEKEPVCTGCSVTERFFLRKRHFYDKENLRKFEREFERKPVYEKALENKPLLIATALAVLVPLIL